MNVIFFGLKRAFHGTLRMARPMLTSLGITAARFDMLYALMKGSRAFGTCQSKLARKLGVTRPTVSRMVRSLEARGLVSRERSRIDRRQIDVRLTDAGRSLIELAHRLLTESGWAQLAVNSALGAAPPENRWYDDGHCLIETERFDGLIRRVRDAFGDFATVRYRWRPDDWGIDYLAGPYELRARP
jgi:DNA-binding MarR family transcriptional regulator